MKVDIDSLIKIINREGYDSSIVKNKSIEYVKSLEIKNTIITDFVPPVENLTVNFSEYIKSEMSDKGGVQIIGEGGSGKSYFLIKTAAELQNDSDVIPLYIPLSQTKSDYGYSIFHYINNVFLEKTSSGGTDEIRKNICMMINQQGVIMPYKYVFLLDGLNEVVVDENVNGNINLYDEISSLSNLKNTFIVVSTRFQLMQPIFSYMSVKRLCPLSRERIEAILKEKKLTISDWYLLEIIRTPCYLMLFLSLYGTEKNYPVLDVYKRVDLIRDYFDFQLNKLELSNDLLQRRQYDIIYNNILPAVAKWTLENEYAFQKEVLTECVEAHRTDLDKMNSDEIIDLIISLCSLTARNGYEVIFQLQQH